MPKRTKDERWQLMRRFSDILDAVDVLNTPPSALAALSPPDHELASQMQRTRSILAFQSLQLMRDALGDYQLAQVFKALGNGPEGMRRDLRWCLTILSAFVPVRGSALGPRPFNLSAINEALAALDIGETRPVFRPSPAPGKRADAFTQAQHWLQAVGWRAFHRALGGKGAEGYATGIVADAYGVGNSTLRGWRASCTEVLGRNKVEQIEQGAAEDAKSGASILMWRVDLPATNGLMRHAPHEVVLQADGQAYRAFLAKAVELPKAAPLALEQNAGEDAISGE